MKFINPDSGASLNIKIEDQNSVPILFDPDTGKTIDVFVSEREVITKLREQLETHMKIACQYGRHCIDKNNELQAAAIHRHNQDAQRLLDLTKEWE